MSSLYFLLKKKTNNKKMGKKNHSKEQKKTKPSTKLTMDIVSILFFLPFYFFLFSFFFFLFFFLPMARRRAALGTEDPFPPHFPLPTALRLPSAPYTRLHLPDATAPPLLTPDVAWKGDFSALERPRVLTGPCKVAQGAGGNGLVGQRQVPTGCL